MIGKNYDVLCEKWLNYWSHENHERPIICICAPQQNRKSDIKMPESLKERWENTEYVIASGRRAMENTYFGGEAVPVFNPNLGPDILGAIAGCDIEYGEDTSWALPCVEDWDKHPVLKFNPENRWWKKIEEITRAAVEDAKGDYLVGITDLHPGADGLVSLRGPQELCYDLIDYEEQILPRTNELFGVYREVYNRLTDIIASQQEGSINWMSIWHPKKRWYVVSCDFSCMLGAADYELFIIPGLRREMEMLEASMYHLDGPDALRHLDTILSFEKLNGVQWVPGAGQPSARYWIDVLKKIQDAGKLVQISCTMEDVLPICEALRPEGVNLIVEGCQNAQEAEELLAAAEKASAGHRKLYVPGI